MNIDRARDYLSDVADSDENTRSGETLEEHRKHCEARSRETCPYERRLDDADASLTEGGVGANESAADKSAEEIDREYADTVARGDKEAALRMIREAAAKAMPNTKVVDKDGLPKVLYHGGALEDKGSNKNVRASEFWLSNDKKEADSYSDDVHPYFVNSENPVTYDVHGNPYFAIYGSENIEEDENGEPINRYTEELVWKHSKSNDETDCVIVKNVLGGSGLLNDFHVVYSHGNERFNRYIKYADITYDDNNNLIPLSKRFDFTNPDIRY